MGKFLICCLTLFHLVCFPLIGSSQPFLPDLPRVGGALVSTTVDIPLTKNVFTDIPFNSDVYNIFPTELLPPPISTPPPSPLTGFHSTVTNPERLTIWEQTGICDITQFPPAPCSRNPIFVKVCASITFSANTNGQRIIKILKNNQVTIGLPLQDLQATGGNQVVNACSAIVPVEKGDYFTVQAYVSGGGGPVSILANAPHSRTYFSIITIDSTSTNFIPM